MASTLIERNLYNGQFHMVHNPTARGSAPRYKVNDKDKPKGVTTILGQTLSKDLMDWAVSCATDYLKERLPVVTAKDLEEAAKQYKVKRDAGAGTGSEAHALVEVFLKAVEAGLDTPGVSGTTEAKNAYGAFVKWFQAVNPRVINVEEVVYSPTFQYAGTYDCMLEVDGKVFLCDFKTTNVSRKAPNGVYAEYFIQLGAYALAHEEQRAYEEDNGGTNLVPIDGLMVISGKKNGKLDIVTNQDVGLTLPDCTGMFKRTINLYNFLNYTTGALGGK